MLKPKKEIEEGYYWVLLTAEDIDSQPFNYWTIAWYYKNRDVENMMPWSCNFAMLDCDWDFIQKLGRKINRPKMV